MALVAYSDSEGSDNETAVRAPAPPARPAISKGEGRKIKVELPAIRPEPGQPDGAQPPPAKRAKTAGAFGDFNSLLPAPKRPAPQTSGLKKGVSLKTSSEAAFSRAPPPAETVSDANQGGDEGYDEFGNRAHQTTSATAPPSAEKGAAAAAAVAASEVKMVGKATRFKPLSVSNHKKKVVKRTKPGTDTESIATAPNTAPSEKSNGPKVDAAPAAPAAKPPKRSLFSVEQDDDVPLEAELDSSDTVVAPAQEAPRVAVERTVTVPTAAPDAPARAPANSLEAAAADLNLTPAQRRHLFGRHAKDASVAHFHMDQEYAANEQARQSGDAVEHKAVKSIAPGKHSLQQLVNNARSNQESIEEKWAEGRRNRGEGGSKYGWSK